MPVTARCPQCQTLYRIAREKIAPTGARLRCTRCKGVFRVEPPPAPEVPKPTIESLERLERVAPESPAPDSPVPEPKAPEPAERVRALIAEADPALAKRVAGYLQSWRVEADVVHDGSDALLGLFRSPPALVILGGHLPGVASPAIVEVVRRSGRLADAHLVRVAPMDEPDGSPGFEADETLEPADLPEALGPMLESLGIGVKPPPPPPAEAVSEHPASPRPAPPIPLEAAREPAPELPALDAPELRTPAPAAPAASGPAATGPSAQTSPELAAAERLARIAVSDIILYNEEKFRAAADAGTLPDALSGELEEARSLFRNRISDEVRAKRDFLVEELMARAARL
jgi:predicted Zn finger-like uncharacterized protein